MFNTNNLILIINRLADSSEWLDESKSAIDTIKMIVESLLVAVVALGLIYVIVLGVAYSRAESGDEKAKAQRKIVNTVIGFVSFLVAIIMLYVFISYMPEVNAWVRDIVRQIFPTSAGTGGGGSTSTPPASNSTGGGDPGVGDIMNPFALLGIFR